LREKLRKQQADEEQKVALTPNGKQTEQEVVNEQFNDAPTYY
jgi:hypothetical protein